MRRTSGGALRPTHGATSFARLQRRRSRRRARLRHVVDGEARDGDRRERLHLDACLRRRLGYRSDLDRRVAGFCLHADMRERQWMAERDQLARPLGGHDPGHFRAGERVALGQLAQAADCFRRHTDSCRRDRASPLVRLAADVDHVHTTGVVEMREVLAHPALSTSTTLDGTLAAATAVTRRS